MSSSFGSAPEWYYYLRNDPHNRADGWYRYEASIEKTIEVLFQRYLDKRTKKRSRQLLPVTASSGYQYEVDFQMMTQRNTTSNKSRPITRTTNGHPPLVNGTINGGNQASYGAANPSSGGSGGFTFGSRAPSPAHSTASGSSAGGGFTTFGTTTAPAHSKSRSGGFNFGSPARSSANSSTSGSSGGFTFATAPAPATRSFSFGRNTANSFPSTPSYNPNYIQAPSTPQRNHSVGWSVASNPRRDGIHVTRQRLTDGGEEISYLAPETLHVVSLDETKIYQDILPPPTTPDESKPAARNATQGAHSSNGNDVDECCICIDALWNTDPCAVQDRVVAIKGCNHIFHYKCIHAALTQGGAKCPLCSKPVESEMGVTKTTVGKCPDATMSYNVISEQHCQGYPNAGTIVISYSVPSGVQKLYHQNPGIPFSGTDRAAYLPATPEGWNILWRMQYGFAHGHMFMVGTSLTTSQPNVVTWASIHNKTSMSGGTYGYPDDTYFQRCNQEMDGLGIPTAAECRAWIDGSPIFSADVSFDCL